MENAEQELQNKIDEYRWVTNIDWYFFYVRRNLFWIYLDISLA
jgi:hypothetical protein